MYNFNFFSNNNNSSVNGIGDVFNYVLKKKNNVKNNYYRNKKINKTS